MLTYAKNSFLILLGGIVFTIFSLSALSQANDESTPQEIFMACINSDISDKDLCIGSTIKSCMKQMPQEACHYTEADLWDDWLKKQIVSSGYPIEFFDPYKSIDMDQCFNMLTPEEKQDIFIRRITQSSCMLFHSGRRALDFKGDPHKYAVIQSDNKNTHIFKVTIADTPESQAKGLMFVTEMPDNEGMIFAYPKPTPTQFWMKNTLIPLDILFFDHQNKLIDIVHNAVPHDETPVGPLTPVCNVLEINGGLAREKGIEIGSRLIANVNHQCLQF